MFQLLLFAVTKPSTQPVQTTTPTPAVKIEISKEVEIQPSEPSISDTVLGSETLTYPERINARVIEVRDGDTIEVDFGGSKKTVRYIGINAPETVDPRKTVQCFGREANNINKSLVEGQIVQLEKDISETDKYGRLLRYVYIGNIFVNQYLVEEGFAHSSSYPPDIKYQEDLDSAEEEARSANKGLWAACGGSSNNPFTVNSNTSTDKDCSDFSTHQNAQDYFISKGGSSTNNVDKLDGSDRDGLVCETLP
ncbi:MAG TPA: thermonuclease family protein [Xanthomonadales bacterium]|nr:thermonuclease family protein [Xanthomonadales bacterium]